MTEEHALMKLEDLQLCGDIEVAHGDADDVLCDFLESLGYTEVVKAYKEIDKWYA